MAVALPRARMTTASDPTTEPRRWRFTVDDYHRMAEAGILTEDDPVELIRGELIEMSPIGGRHLTSVSLLDEVLHAQVGKEVMILTQSSIQLPDHSEPQPDFAIVRRAFYDPDPPVAGDVFLVIEVADSSLSHDRNTKLPLYAAAGIPEAWIFDLTGDRIERHTDPGPNGYRQIRLAEQGQSLTSTVLPTVVLSIDAVLPAAE